MTAGGRLVEATSIDVSSEGVRLVSTESPDVGAQVSLVFFLLGELVVAHGMVRWCEPLVRGYHAFGVKFEALEDDSAALLEGFCRRAVS
jgi:PilZ domain